MPIYEYRCEYCGELTEILQKVSDEPATQCPSCNKPGLKRQISAAGFQLKGGGWYVTDFRGKKESSSEKKSTENTSSESSPSTETKSEPTKPTETKKDE